MKIHVMSDIHFEHKRADDMIYFLENLKKVQDKDPANLCILAGDICSVGYTGGQWRQSMAQLCSAYEKVLYVPGNHEFYGNSFDDVADFFENMDKDPNFHNLVNLDRLQGAYEYGGERFIGGTMWFEDKKYSNFQKRCLMDFSAIKDFEPEVYLLHRHFLKKWTAARRHGDIIVTHHTPLPASIAPYWAGSSINDFFMSDRTGDLYEGNLPKLWIHGHTHNAFDYDHWVGTSNMRVYCNPNGYPNENENVRFFEGIVIDV